MLRPENCILVVISQYVCSLHLSQTQWDMQILILKRNLTICSAQPTVCRSLPASCLFIILKLLTRLEVHDYHFNSQAAKSGSGLELYIMPVMTWSYNNLGT